MITPFREPSAPFILLKLWSSSGGSAEAERGLSRRPHDELVIRPVPVRPVKASGWYARFKNRFVKSAGDFALPDLGLRDGGLKIRIPYGRAFRRVDLAGLEKPDEAALVEPAAIFIARRVLERPVDTRPRPGEEVFEQLFIFVRHTLAERDEVGSAAA
jgi:hypothetical protein